MPERKSWHNLYIIYLLPYSNFNLPICKLYLILCIFILRNTGFMHPKIGTWLLFEYYLAIPSGEWETFQPREMNVLGSFI